MRKLIVAEFITLDGVIQAPGGADEDTDGGFAHGGWTHPYWHDEIGAALLSSHDGMPTRCCWDERRGRRHGDAFEPIRQREIHLGM